MTKCQHCGKDCIIRVAVRSKGKILMVGTSCSKKFKRARIKDLLRDAALSDAIAKRQSSHGGDPSRYSMSKNDFELRFPNAAKDLYRNLWTPLEWYNWNGMPVVLFKNHKGKLVLSTKDQYGNHDIQEAEIIYEDVSKAKTPGVKVSVATGYEYNVIGIEDPPSDIKDPKKGKILEWVDEFNLWDPIKKYGLEVKFDAVPASSIYSYKSKIFSSSKSSTYATPTSHLNHKDYKNTPVRSVKLKYFDIFSERSEFEDCDFEYCMILLTNGTEVDASKISNCEIIARDSTIKYTSIFRSTFKDFMKNSDIYNIKLNECVFQDMQFENNYFEDIDILSEIIFYNCKFSNDQFKNIKNLSIKHSLFFDSCEFDLVKFIDKSPLKVNKLIINECEINGSTGYYFKNCTGKIELINSNIFPQSGGLTVVNLG